MYRTNECDKRLSVRFDKAFQVTVISDLFGEMVAVARNISSGGIGLQMCDPLPLGTVVVVKFTFPGDRTSVSVRAEVKHHYCFNYNVGAEAAATRGIGLRFIEFLEDREEQSQDTFTRRRSIH